MCYRYFVGRLSGGVVERVFFRFRFVGRCVYGLWGFLGFRVVVSEVISCLVFVTWRLWERYRIFRVV